MLDTIVLFAVTLADELLNDEQQYALTMANIAELSFIEFANAFISYICLFISIYIYIHTN